MSHDLQGSHRDGEVQVPPKKEILEDKNNTPTVIWLWNIQAEIFSGQMRGFWNSAPPKHRMTELMTRR